MNWVAPIWEPKWLSIKMAKESHTEYHDMVLNPESNPIAIAWMKHERERIIALLEAHATGECGFGVTHDLTKLIKDDNASQE